MQLVDRQSPGIFIIESFPSEGEHNMTAPDYRQQEIPGSSFGDGVISLKDTAWTREEILRGGKSGISALYRQNGSDARAVLKEYRDYPDNYISLDHALDTELHSYQVLKELGIPCPRLIGFSREKNLLFKEYVPGPTVMELLADAPLSWDLIYNINKYALLAKRAGYNIDFFPANFVWTDNRVYYIDYEVQPYSDE